MMNLLSANLLRLRKSLLFWAGLALSFGFGLFVVYTRYSDLRRYGEGAKLEALFFIYAMLVGFAAAVFTGLFFGTEYSDGAIRNKVAAGCSRWAVYFSSLLVSLAASLLFCAGYMLAILIAAPPIFGFFTLGAKLILTTLLGTAVMTAAFCSIYTFISMNCSQKAAGAVLCLVAAFGLMIVSTYVGARLDAKEEHTTISLVDGQLVYETEPNPRYLQGSEREVYQFIYDLLPTGQASQYFTFSAESPLRLMGYSLLICITAGAAGGALFNKKDLK